MTRFFRESGALAMKHFGFPFACLLAAVLLAGSAMAEEEAERAERFDALIESLNASSDRRASILDGIYQELRGPYSQEMRESLRAALLRSNTYILLGASEALAMLGDAGDLPAMEVFLATCEKLEAKTQAIRLLPAFCLGGSERARFAYIRYAIGWERTADPAVLALLRRPPLTRRGRLDTGLDRLRNRVALDIAVQVDPVGGALRLIDDRQYGSAARTAVIHYTGDALGKDPSRWVGIWATQGERMASVVPDELEEVRLALLQVFSDMGAEGLPEVLGALRRLADSGDPLLGQSTFESMTVMCRTAFGDVAALSAMRFDDEDATEAESWRRRRLASAVDLALFAAEAAGRELSKEGMDAAAYGAAVACLGAAVAYPDDFSDPGGLLAGARAAGLERLERLLLAADLLQERRAAVAAALGEIGASGAVASLIGLLDSPYCSSERGAAGERMAEAAVDALHAAASGAHGGRDAARKALLALLGDTRVYPSVRSGAPPVGVAHIVLWKLQRLARTSHTSFDGDWWRERLGW